MSTRSAKRTIEAAIRDNYLKHSTHAPAVLLECQQLVSKDPDTQTLPRLYIFATDVKTTEGFEGTDSGELTAILAIGVVTSPDDTEAADADRLVDAAECMMDDLPELIGAVNKPAIGIDARPVKDVYLHSCSRQSTQEDVDDRHQTVVFTYQIHFRADNGDNS